MLTIVMGPSCSGKSTYIKKYFPNIDVIDLYSYQYNNMTIDEVWESYQKCADAVIKLLKENKDVVLEHTLLKRIRREWYINQFREVYDGDINIICFKPSLKTLLHRGKLRKTNLNYLQQSLDLLEIPTKDEGYTNITIIEE